MELRNPELEIFDGLKAPEQFMGDLEVFLKLREEAQQELIQNTMLWYPQRDIDAEWNKWVEKKTEDEKKKLARALRLILYVAKAIIVKRVSNELIRKELTTIGFQPKLIDFFLNEFEINKGNWIRKIERIESPVIARLDELNWRVDLKKSSAYSTNINEPCVIFRLSFIDSKEKDVVFELSLQEFNSFLRTLSIIQNELAKYRSD